MEQFLFIGDSPALDFVNTEIAVRGALTDLLNDESDLIRWLSASGLASSGAVKPVRKRWLGEAKALRAELRAIFLRLAAGKSLRAADLKGLNAALARCEGGLWIALRRGRPHLQTNLRSRPSPAFLIARAAAEFLSSADLSRVRRCEGSGCVLLFYDTTKSHTRRWCSMTECGNRSKAAAHYRRVHRRLRG